MSGGSMNYLAHRIESDMTFYVNTPERNAFYEHMQKIIKALHDIEWVDSGDMSPGDENKAIMECISESDVIMTMILQAKKVSEELQAKIDILESHSHG